MNSQKIKTWICSKCYEFVCQPSNYDKSSQSNGECNSLNEQFTLNSFEKYANHFKERYFSMDLKEDQQNVNPNQMDIDQEEKKKNNSEDNNSDDIKPNTEVNSDSISSFKKSSIVINNKQIEKEFWNLMNLQSDIIIKCGEHLISEKYGR